MYRFRSVIVVSCLDLYVFLGYYLPIQLPLKLSNEYDDRLLDHFHHVYIFTDYEMCNYSLKMCKFSCSSVHGENVLTLYNQELIIFGEESV